MSGKPVILCVDDEPHVLEGLQRSLYRSFDVRVAGSGREALNVLEASPVSVILSDMRMPEMDGAELLAEVRRRYPSIERIMLTGHSDLNDAAEAVNRGNIFRFLLKPCDREVLVRAVQDALEHQRLGTLERDLLDRTLGGAIHALVELLRVAAPHLRRESVFFERVVRALLPLVPEEERWACQTAASLAFIGHVVLPEGSLDALMRGRADAQLLEMERAARRLAAKMVEEIPRLETVGALIRFIDVPKPPQGGARLLWSAHRFLRAVHGGLDARRAAAEAAHGSAEIEANLAGIQPETVGNLYQDLPLAALQPGMVVGDDIKTVSGVTVARSGHVLTVALIERLNVFQARSGLAEPIRVLTE